MAKLTGVGVALITPFTKDSTQVDFDSFKRVLENLNPYVDYFVVNGTTAESPTLSQQEKQDILNFVKENNTDNKPIVFGLGGYNTKGIIKIFEEMDLSSVDAILSVSPQYVRPTQKGIIEHFNTLADAFNKPIVLYNVPPRTGSNMTSATTLTLAQHENIIGIKEASGNIAQCMEIAAHKPDNFLLISGDDGITIPLASFGGAGVISVIANGMPKPFYNAVQQALKGQFKEASETYFPIMKLNQLLFEEGNPAGIKALCELEKLCNATVRMPLARATEDLFQKIEAQLNTIYSHA